MQTNPLGDESTALPRLCLDPPRPSLAPYCGTVGKDPALLPRRRGEMGLRIDSMPSELYYKAIAYTASLRMALFLSIAGLDDEVGFGTKAATA
jgi:hypothetical protein